MVDVPALNARLVVVVNVQGDAPAIVTVELPRETLRVSVLDPVNVLLSVTAKLPVVNEPWLTVRLLHVIAEPSVQPPPAPSKRTDVLVPSDTPLVVTVLPVAVARKKTLELAPPAHVSPVAGNVRLPYTLSVALAVSESVALAVPTAVRSLQTAPALMVTV